MKCVLIAGTGTGGHVFPAVAVAEALKQQEKDIRIVFVRAGRKRIDDSVFAGLGDVVWIPGTGMPTGFSLKFATFLFQTARSLIRSLRITGRYSPDAVIGFGNFGSYGPLRAAAFRKIPVFLHEANRIMGKANRFLSKYAECVGVNFPDAGNWLSGRRVEEVGMPVRKEFNEPRNRACAVEYFGLDDGKPVLFVTGGSQGARHINEAVCGMLKSLKESGMQVIHLTGSEGYQAFSSAHVASGVKSCVKPFESRMKLAFDAADIIISRAGASSLAEISATGKPAILVPYPFATDNHQYHNAKLLSDNNAAMLVLDKDITPEMLLSKMNLLMADEGKRSELSRNCAKYFVPDSANKMAAIVLQMCSEKRTAGSKH
jgi:UDP-N-acetylglucosamine--N-acetylmuramyl-(pentapeptide) pyrophosphoryl-undecaprenol N-acetylglucosamine transferase